MISAQTEALKKPIRDAIIKLCVEAHQEQDFRNLFTYVSSGGWHFLAYHDELLVSHAMVTTRWLQTKDLLLLKTAYIDAVSTRPAYQDQGYGSALMQQLASEIDRQYVIACLETDRETFYERLGWQTWRGPLAGRRDSDLIPTPEQHGVMVLPLSQTPLLILIRC